MNFTDVVNGVLDAVKRPDKILEIKRNVNQALSTICLANNFARDLQEELIVIDPAAYAQSIPLARFVRFRKFEYMRPSNRKCYVHPVAATKIFAKGRELLDTYYVAGDQVNFKLAVPAPELLAGWFAHPPILTEAAGTFWLLEVCPYLIIDKAAAMTFKTIGDDTSARAKELEFLQQASILLPDLTYGVKHG